MTRTDIANYLRLAPETVSRGLSASRTDGLLRGRPARDRADPDAISSKHWPPDPAPLIAAGACEADPARPIHLDLDQARGARSRPRASKMRHPIGDRHEQYPKALAGPGRPAARVVHRPAVVGRPDFPRGAADSRARRSARTATSSTRGPTSSRVDRSGNRSAACNWVRSGAMAATSRPTGAPTGCIAKRPTCSTTGRAATTTRAAYAQLPAEQQAGLRGRLQQMMRTNTYDPATTAITLTQERVIALSNVAAHYESLFGNDPATAKLREGYAMKEGTVDTVGTSACAHRLHLVDRVGGDHRAPGRRTSAAPDPNGVSQQSPTPTTGRTNRWSATRRRRRLWLWSAFSVLFLIAGIAVLGWHHAVSHGRGEEPHRFLPPIRSRCCAITPSMRATAKYFWVVLALFLAQILLGAITAHYQVEGQKAYGFALSERSCRIRCRAPGTRSWRCCGSRSHGSARACTSARHCPAMSRSSSAWASTSCSPAC